MPHELGDVARAQVLVTRCVAAVIVQLGLFALAVAKAEGRSHLARGHQEQPNSASAPAHTSGN